MVQRKLPTKLTLQPHHAQTQTQEIKSPRGADLKAKKMKKSGSIKRPKHPGKPPPPPPTTPPPPPPVCKTAATPNYMKSTTSSDARREQSQVKAKSSGRKATKAVARTLTKNPSFKPARTAVVRKCDPVVICENLDSQRATCSSTLKDCKFPAYLSLNPGATESEGTSAIKVCPYTYCSLNGHHHAPLPPLKCFVSARRRAIKTQRSVKLGCSSPRRARAVGDDDDLRSLSVGHVTEEQNKDFFVEIFTADGAGIDETAAEDSEERVCCGFDAFEGVDGGQINQEEFLNEPSSPNVDFHEQDSDGSEMDWETGYCSPLQLDYDYQCSSQTEVEPDPEADAVDDQIIKEEFIVKDCCFDEVLVDDASQESFDEEGFSSDAFSSSDDDESTGVYDDLQCLSTTNTSESIRVVVEEAEGARYEENRALPECKTSGTDDHEASFDDLDLEFLPNEEAVVVTGDEVTEAELGIFSKAKGENAKEPETEDIALLHFTANSKKLVHDGDELGAFNPRAPNFLPLQPDPEAQKVDLRHQDLDERKNSEEWMVDYALRQVVTKLGPARKRKVALLVEAFEKVIPTTKYDLHLRPGSALDQARPIQACS